MNDAPKKSWLGITIGLIAIILIVGGYLYYSKFMTPAPANEQSASAPSDVTQDVTQTPTEAIVFNKITMGEETAPIKIIEYYSLTCPHCAHFYTKQFPAVKEKYIDTGKASIEYRDYPLNKPALDAAMVLHCMPADKQIPFMSLLMETQEHWAFQADYLKPLQQSAKLAGMGEEEFKKCVEDTVRQEALVKHLKADSEKHKVTSTPTFIFNDGAQRIIGAQDVKEFDKTISKIENPDAPDSNKEKTQEEKK